MNTYTYTKLIINMRRLKILEMNDLGRACRYIGRDISASKGLRTNMPKTIASANAEPAMAIDSAPRKRAVSAAYELFREIIRGLYEGRYVPGQRLVEADLIRDHGVSRFVVREALKMLMNEGVVSIGFNRGAQIPRLTRIEARDSLTVMQWLFALAARSAAERIDLGNDRETLVASTNALLAFAHDSDFFEFGRACSNFFRTITKLGGNKELHRLLPTLQIHIVRAQFRTFPNATENHRLTSFKTMSDAILSGDPDAAEAAVRRHFVDLADDIAALPDRAFR
ncbi:MULTISPECIES: GntR family transcriptional regulator [unclassified Bradyrhizobium]|uniref:GntR family transcriptional regulator n=1 Tax=unclassified Bradyrhizobium TaxID=2631580 RepID=UPI003395D99C